MVLRWILTAGHCLNNKSDNIFVLTDIKSDGEYQNRLEIAEQFIHPDFTLNEADETTTNDIGEYIPTNPTKFEDLTTKINTFYSYIPPKK